MKIVIVAKIRIPFQSLKILLLIYYKTVFSLIVPIFFASIFANSIFFPIGKKKLFRIIYIPYAQYSAFNRV